MKRISILLCLAMLASAACSGDENLHRQSPDAALADSTPINALQMIGSHNSYKLFMDPKLEAALREKSPSFADALYYGHESLTAQLVRGLRNLEIDVLYDPEGGAYASPLGYEGLNSPRLPFEPDALREPGYKVLHIQDFDFRTNCPTLAICLEELEAWSDANPHHAPVMVTMNIKQGPSPLPLQTGVDALTFTAQAADALDAEIVTHLGQDDLITPDDVRGSHMSLKEAVTTTGWPTLGKTRGRFIFILDEAGQARDIYADGRPNLEGRVAFANFPENNDAAAILILNEPIELADRIKSAVQNGFIVRTRADANTIEARTNDTTRRDAAFASGAQIVTTDYYEGRNAFGNDYKVVFPDGDYLRENSVVKTP